MDWLAAKVRILEGRLATACAKIDILFVPTVAVIDTPVDMTLEAAPAVASEQRGPADLTVHLPSPVSVLSSGIDDLILFADDLLMDFGKRSLPPVP